MSKFNIPNESQVKSYMDMLFGTVEVAASSAVDTKGKGNIIGSYLDDENVPVALCICDLGFSAYAGSALTRIPPGGAQDAVKTGELQPGMLANLDELLNIFSRYFIGDNTPHLRFDRHFVAQEAPEDVLQVVEKATGKAHFKVTLAQYGSGSFTLLTV